MAAPAGLSARRAHEPAPVPCCPLAPASAAPVGRCWDSRKHDAGRRGAERAGPDLRAGSAVRQDGGGALPSRTSGPARARTRSARIGHGGGPSRLSAEPSERRRAQLAALEGRWTQVRVGGARGDRGGARRAAWRRGLGRGFAGAAWARGGAGPWGGAGRGRRPREAGAGLTAPFACLSLFRAAHSAPAAGPPGPRPARTIGAARRPGRRVGTPSGAGGRAEPVHDTAVGKLLSVR